MTGGFTEKEDGKLGGFTKKEDGRLGALQRRMGDWGLYRGGWETRGFTEEDGRLGALQRRMMGN